MIFGLVLKLEISYRVMISCKILVSFRGFFWKMINFWMVKYLSFHNSLFALRYFKMKMARPQCDTTLVCKTDKVKKIQHQYWAGKNL